MLSHTLAQLRLHSLTLKGQILPPRSFFPCLPLRTQPPSRPSPPPRKWKCLIPAFCPGFNPHVSLFHFHVLQVLSSEGNSHLGNITWSVRSWINVGKVKKKWVFRKIHCWGSVSQMPILRPFPPAPPCFLGWLNWEYWEHQSWNFP